MNRNLKFFVCMHCGNIVQLINNKGVPVMCCGERMEELVPNTQEAAVEKHLPVTVDTSNGFTVNVGSVEHPMVEEHYIMFIYVETEQGGQLKYLKPGDKPTVEFTFANDKPIAVYAYCNIHGLWKTEI